MKKWYRLSLKRQYDPYMCKASLLAEEMKEEIIKAIQLMPAEELVINSVVGNVMQMSINMSILRETIDVERKDYNMKFELCMTIDEWYAECNKILAGESIFSRADEWNEPDGPKKALDGILVKIIRRRTEHGNDDKEATAVACG